MLQELVRISEFVLRDQTLPALPLMPGQNSSNTVVSDGSSGEAWRNMWQGDPSLLGHAPSPAQPPRPRRGQGDRDSGTRVGRRKRRRWWKRRRFQRLTSGENANLGSNMSPKEVTAEAVKVNPRSRLFP